MASRIQGITVEIGGDTTKLSKALESVNKSIKGTQSGLKDVNKLLKLDPSNTELVVQKQKMLKDAIEATKEKLATLKTAAQQANEQLANGEITQQQYDALQREIVETEQNLRSLQDQAATTNATLAKIDEAGEKLQNIGSSVENVGKKFLPVTAAVTGLGTAAVKTAADFDSEMSKVSAISGATGDDFDQLRAKAREMGAKTKFSASEAASAMEYMAMAGWKTGDMLNGIEGIMNLAAASGEDLATTSDIVTDALTAFGLSAADSGHFADILAAASSNANTNVSMMGETFKYCAPIAGALGFSAEDTAEAIGLMANSGIKASQAGTSLRTIMNNLSGEVTFVGKNIGEVTIATSNADGSMRSLNDILADCRVAFSGLSESEKAANAEALVGKNAMSGFLALMNSSEKDINKLRGAIENCDGASESMAETMQDNLNGQLTILKSQLEELAISFGDILMPTIRKIVSAVQQFVDKLNSMDESTRETIIKIGLLAASIGPLLIVLGKTMDNIMEGMDQQRVDSVYTPAAGSAEAMYNELLKDILKRKEELENELHILEENSEGGIILKKRYEYFLEELLALPEQNLYGQKLVVHGLDDKEAQWTESGVFLSTPDMLTFSREMYAVNIESGRVDGDVIHYRTIYGMEFTAFGARRTIKDFKDYRVYGKDGKPKFAENEAEILGEPVQVEYRKRRNGKKI